MAHIRDIVIDGYFSALPAVIAVQHHCHAFADAHGGDISEMERSQIADVFIYGHLPAFVFGILFSWVILLVYM